MHFQLKTHAACPVGFACRSIERHAISAENACGSIERHAFSVGFARRSSVFSWKCMSFYRTACILSWFCTSFYRFQLKMRVVLCDDMHSQPKMHVVPAENACRPSYGTTRHPFYRTRCIFSLTALPPTKFEKQRFFTIVSNLVGGSAPYTTSAV